MHRSGRKHGVRVRALSDASMAALMAHDWPGNVRELQNVIERAVILCGESGVLEPEHLGFVPQAAPASQAVAAASGLPNGNVAASPAEILPLADLEKRQILTTLDHTKGNRTHAAKLLGISIRTLRNKLNEYGVNARDNGDSDGDTA